jgi:hypothetical protein
MPIKSTELHKWEIHTSVLLPMGVPRAQQPRQLKTVHGTATTIREKSQWKLLKTVHGTSFTPKKLRLHTAIVKILIAPINPCFAPVVPATN